MSPRLWRVAPLLFCSGACALTYQLAWTRELRLVFGSSTPASAAVLAVFMGGIGIGSALIGPRVDRSLAPLRWYAVLELTVAASAALSPAFLLLVHRVYVALGGVSALGHLGATSARLLLSALALGLPTIAMGGTLPAAVRAVERDDDVERRWTGLLYFANTAGAVVGCLAPTFYFFEAMGIQATLLSAAALNGLVGAAAWVASSLEPPHASRPAPPSDPADSPPAMPVRVICAAAAVVGFVFFLMELVWYRMLTPLLGGTTFTLGVILAVALAGIGLGGGLYALRKRRPSGWDFGITCGLEALAFALPFALGDRIALIALLLRSSAAASFGAFVGGWVIVAAILVLPAAVVAGYQFPLLVAMLGTGGERVGRDVGWAYAWNTAGAIAGSLAGGFGLLAALGALGCWRLAVGLLVVAALATLRFVGRRGTVSRAALIFAPALALASCFARGPTAVWRQSSIGGGRATSIRGMTSNQIEDWSRRQRRTLLWQTDGVESNVGLTRENGLAFVVNGRTDGNSLFDAPMQVMGGMIGAILHPAPRKALVIGLGTGSTAGWLASIPAIERVDVVEIEPAILRVARDCAAVNQRVLDNPKVHLVLDDAREVLEVSREKYDLIFSEPSNPFRAGISSLYTREFYAGVREHLADGGVFLQWLQAYEIDGQSVRVAMATLRSALPVVETWEPDSGDLLFAARERPFDYDVSRLRSTVAEEPYRSALLDTWRTDSLEGFLARFVATDAVARQTLAAGERLNTDDHPYFEFGVARSVGREGLWHPRELRAESARLDANRPSVRNGAVDWSRVAEEKDVARAGRGIVVREGPDTPAVVRALSEINRGNPAEALAIVQQASVRPRGPIESFMIADLLAEASDPTALEYTQQLGQVQPAEADVLRARWAALGGDLPGATAMLESAFRRHQSDPWPRNEVILEGFQLAERIASEDSNLGARLFEALRAPFAVFALDEPRRNLRARLSESLGDRVHCAEAFHDLEPDFPWERDLLAARERCYRRVGDPLLARAERELAQFTSRESQRP